MGKISNEVKRQLSDIANKLPPSYYEGKQYYFEEVVDLRRRELMNNAIDGQGFEMHSERNQQQLMKADKLHEVNHLRRLRKAYLAKGWTGVLEYCRGVRATLDRLEDKYKMRYDMTLINAILKEKIKPIF